MLRLDQVPLEVKRAMRAAWARRNNSDSPEKHMADLAVAAINAWPGMFSAIRTEEGGVEWDNEGNAPECLVLPLPQEEK